LKKKKSLGYPLPFFNFGQKKKSLNFQIFTIGNYWEVLKRIKYVACCFEILIERPENANGKGDFREISRASFFCQYHGIFRDEHFESCFNNSQQKMVLVSYLIELPIDMLSCSLSQSRKLENRNILSFQYAVGTRTVFVAAPHFRQLLWSLSRINE